MSLDNVYQDAQIVWVKLRSCWWPGEVCSHNRQPEGLLKHIKRKPYCVVKFFQEDSYEYVKNAKMICPFNCSKKDEFIRKGHALLAKNKYMEQFPAAVSTAERLTRSLTRSSLFYTTRPDSIIKAVLTDSPPKSERIRKGRQCEIVDKILTTKSPETPNLNQSSELSPTYKCSLCDFQSTRQNVMVLHRRSHSGSGATPLRNCLPNRSVVRPSTTKRLDKSPEPDQTPKTTTERNIVIQTPVSKNQEVSPPVSESSDVIVIDPDVTNATEKNITTKCSSKESSESISTAFIRPPPKKQLNFMNCKSEIQKSLLADWIDEDKDDDEEHEDECSLTKEIESFEINTTTVNKNNQHGSISSASTSASAEQLRNQESLDKPTSEPPIEPLKPFSKIRNIPKKDRRNIVFNDFNETEEIFNVNSQSKVMDEPCSHFDLTIENDSPKAPSVDAPSVEIIEEVEVVEEPSIIDISTEETPSPSTLTRRQRHKLRLTDAHSSYKSRLNSKGKSQGRKSTQHEDKDSEISIESVPVDVTFSQLTAEDNSEVSKERNTSLDLDHSFEENKISNKRLSSESGIQENLSLEVISVDTSQEESIKLSSPTEPSELNEFEQNLEKPTLGESTTGESGVEKSSTPKSSFEEPIVVESSSEESFSLESFTTKSATELTSVKSSSLEPTLKNVTSELTSVEADIPEPSAIDPVAEESHVEESSMKELEEQSTRRQSVTQEVCTENTTIVDHITSSPTLVAAEEINTQINPTELESISEGATEVEENATNDKEINSEEPLIEKTGCQESLEPETSTNISSFEPSSAIFSSKMAVENYSTAKEQIEGAREAILQTESLAGESLSKTEVIEVSSEKKTTEQTLEEQNSSSKIEKDIPQVPQDSEMEVLSDSSNVDSLNKELQGTSSKRRRCRRDVVEDKEIETRRTRKTNAKKIKLINNSSKNEPLNDASLEICNSGTLSIVDQKLSTDPSEKQHLTPIPTEEQSEEHLTDGVNISESEPQKMSNETYSGNESKCEPELSKQTESIKTCDPEPCGDVLNTVEESVDKTKQQSDETNNSVPSSETKSQFSASLDEHQNKEPTTVSESNEPKSRSSFSKASLACFDFNEEEDILTSIANFKKTYVSPEKNYNFSLDNRPKTPDAQKVELEMKDKQLSDDIENLLKTTTLPVTIAASTSSVSSRPFPNEVRGLPIKERGKRIFKSRNRFRLESCTSVPTSSSATEVKSSNSLQPTIAVESNKQVEETQEITKQESSEDKSKEEKSNEEKSTTEERTMDSKITNSQEEIIGRIAFSPAEVYAASNEEPSKDSTQMRESLVSSSSVEIPSESAPLVSHENIEECANNIVEQNDENLTLSGKTTDMGEVTENVLNSHFDDENEKISKEVRNEDETFMQEIGLNQDNVEENETCAFDASATVEVQESNYADNLEEKHDESKLMDETANSSEMCHEEQEHEELVYDKEMSIDEEMGKTNDLNCESPFEYELVTTEVSTIIDHISNEDQSYENAKETSTELSEEVVSCCDDGTFLNEMIIADVAESQSSIPENEMDNCNLSLKYVEVESGTIEHHADESNSYSISGENNIQVPKEDDEKLQAAVEHGDASSDDSSTIISDAEAEFGSPTSMLEEERVLNRGVAGNETPSLIIDGRGNKTPKKSTRKSEKSFKDSKTMLQSLQCDTQESASNELVYDENNRPTDSQAFETQTNYSSDKLPENEIDSKECEKDYDNIDSSEEEEEEEISSPPIEPLIDEDTEAEIVEHFSTNTNSSKIDVPKNSDTKETSSQQSESGTENTSSNEKDGFYTVTQKSDTIIKLNKHKDKVTNVDDDKGWTETSVDVRKSEIAGEELSAVEALLLIPNQPANMLTNLSESTKNLMGDTTSDVQKPLPLLVKEEIIEKAPECSEPTTSQNIILDTKDDAPKEEVVRKKRRTHMKVTPRKRIISADKPEGNAEESINQAKMIKLGDSTQFSGLKSTKPENAEAQKETSQEQASEDSFVLKYMKEQIKEEIESAKSTKTTTKDSDKSPEKQALEKVHITVDISNPLSSQIANILGTNRSAASTETPRSGTKKRKQSVEDDIPSFIIKRPCPKTVAEEEQADRDTIAQIQTLCPQVEIKRKPSKDDQNSSKPIPQQCTSKPQIINQQILRTGNNLITVTPKGNKPEEGVFDISNMPILLTNEKMANEKVHLVITPTTNPQIIKQFQNQQQTSTSFTDNTAGNVSKAGIPARRTSSVRTKRTPSRHQLPEQQQISEVKSFEQESYRKQQQNEYMEKQQQQLQQQHIQEEHNEQHHQRQNQGQTSTQNQYQQQQFHQQQHQNQIQQQLQEEQNILMQHQLLLQQQLQFQQHPQQQVVTNEKASQSNISEKQIGIDNRGNKYVIIRNPSNTVVMANSPDPNNTQQQRVAATTESLDKNAQRKQRQKKQSPLTVQSGTVSKSPLPLLTPLPVTTPPPNISSVATTPTNQPQQYYKDQQHIASPSIPVPQPVTTKPKGRGRGRPPKNKTETVVSYKPQTTSSNNIKVNANGRRSTGRICEPPRQRSTRSLAVTSPSEATMTSGTMYPTNQQQTQSVGYMVNQQFNSMPVATSPSIRANNESCQTQNMGLSPQSRPPTAAEVPIEESEVSGGGYAVPSLPVPGYPQTYLLCELIGNKYKEVFPKPLYLSPDRSRFLEVPDELVTEAHKKLSDARREPNPNALKLVSDGTPHILQSRLIEINSENMVNQNESNGQPNEALMQKHNQHLSVQEQASALLCLQEQLSQEQLAQDRLVQNQLVQEQMVQEQFVEEQFVQEQFVQEQFVPEQFVQEQFVQEQFVPEQFVQEQFVQEQFVPEQFVQEQFNLQPQQFSLQLARFETGEVIEDAERGQMMVVTTGTHNLILDDKSFFEFTGEKKSDFYNAEKDTYVLTPQVISSLLHHYALGHITAVPALNTEMGDQQEVSIADVIQNADSSTNILEVALDESGLYSEEQFINTGQILQIETPEGMQLIGTAADNADLIFHHMAKANTNETNVLLNQAPKMSAVEIPSDKSKQRFETKPSTPATLEDCLNVIGVPIQSPSVPTSLELPASVTNPAIVAKTRTPTPGTITMNEIIATGLCHHPDITSLPSMSSNDQELSYEFFQSNTESHEDKDQVNEESVVTDMGEYAVVTSGASFDDPGR